MRKPGDHRLPGFDVFTDTCRGRTSRQRQNSVTSATKSGLGRFRTESTESNHQLEETRRNRKPPARIRAARAHGCLSLQQGRQTMETNANISKLHQPAGCLGTRASSSGRSRRYGLTTSGPSGRSCRWRTGKETSLSSTSPSTASYAAVTSSLCASTMWRRAGTPWIGRPSDRRRRADR